MNNSIVSARVSTATQCNAVQLHALEKSQRWSSLEWLHFDYKEGKREFSRGRLEQTLSIDLSTPAGMNELAKAGFALVRVKYKSLVSRQSDVLEIRAASTPLARMVNLSRLGNRSACRIRKLLRDVLGVKRTPMRRELYVTEKRRDQAYKTLKKWGITCKELGIDRSRILLQADWLLT